MQMDNQPITGNEEDSDFQTPERALVHFYRAFNTRDIALMAENWEQSEEASMDNPIGGIMRGWKQIRSVYERIFESPSRVQVEFYDYTLHIVDRVFWVVGRERGYFERDGMKLSLAIRTTRMFRRSDSDWRQVHHHGSIDDAKALKNYQRAIRTPVGSRASRQTRKADNVQ